MPLLRNHSPSVNRNAALKTEQDLGSEQSVMVRDSQTSVFPLPDLTDMVRTASLVFAGIRAQSWDIARTADRPAFFELNDGGNLNLHKFARGAGILAATYREHLRSRGYRGKL